MPEPPPTSYFGEQLRAAAAARNTGNPSAAALYGAALRLIADSPSDQALAASLRDDYDGAEPLLQAVLEQFVAAGDQRGVAYTLRHLGFVALNTGQPAAARAYLQESLTIVRDLGDRVGESLALNALGCAASDRAEARGYYEQALLIAQSLGDHETAATLANNLAVVYVSLGLYRQARDYAGAAVDLVLSIDRRSMLPICLETLGRTHEGLGDAATAQAFYTLAHQMADQHDAGFEAACCLLGIGRVALAVGDFDQAEAHCTAAAAMFAALGFPGEEAAALAWLGAAALACGLVDDALHHTNQATALIAAGHTSSEYPAQEVWWWRYKALAASADPPPGELEQSLERARLWMLDGITTLSDAGLCRSYLCNVPINRAIVEAWASQSADVGDTAVLLPDPRARLQDQLTRLLSMAARLNEQHDTGTLYELLLDEVVELCGAERLLLLISQPGEPIRLIARGADAATLHPIAAPALDTALSRRQPILHADFDDPHAPVLAPLPIRRRSAVAVPLVSGGRVVGAIYADLLLAFGRLDTADLDLLSLLATQASTALENARLYAEIRQANAELEARVAARTADLQAANDALAASMAVADAARIAAERANAAKSSFLASMSHELRTPLNAILGFAQLIARDQEINPRQRDHAAIIGRSGEHLLGLINDLLEMARIESGSLALIQAPFEPHRLISGVAELFQMSAAARNVAVQIDLAPELPQLLIGDEARLRQIMINLLSNAIKFTRVGRVTVTTAIQPESEALRLLIQVNDTGEGIAPEELATLFMPFSQTASGRRAREGSGLGLMISRELARLMGGDIRVESALGVGSTFTCEVLLRLADEQAHEHSVPRQLFRLAPEAPRRRVLVANENADRGRLLVELLGSLGLEVCLAADGAETLSVWERWHPQLVLVTFQLPLIDGLEVARRIKSGPGGRFAVVIACCPNACDCERQVAHAAGCDDLITDMENEEQLLSTIARHLGLRLFQQTV